MAYYTPDIIITNNFSNISDMINCDNLTPPLEYNNYLDTYINSYSKLLNKNNSIIINQNHEIIKKTYLLNVIKFFNKIQELSISNIISSINLFGQTSNFYPSISYLSLNKINKLKPTEIIFLLQKLKSIINNYIDMNNQIYLFAMKNNFSRQDKKLIAQLSNKLKHEFINFSSFLPNNSITKESIFIKQNGGTDEISTSYESVSNQSSLNILQNIDSEQMNNIITKFNSSVKYHCINPIQKLNNYELKFPFIKQSSHDYQFKTSHKNHKLSINPNIIINHIKKIQILYQNLDDKTDCKEKIKDYYLLLLLIFDIILKNSDNHELIIDSSISIKKINDFHQNMLSSNIKNITNNLMLIKISNIITKINSLINGSDQIYESIIICPKHNTFYDLLILDFGIQLFNKKML
jgi:hypothetical protein